MTHKKRGPHSLARGQGDLITRRDFMAQGATLLGGLSAASIIEPFHLARPAQANADALRAQIDGREVLLGNNAVEARWEISPAGLRLLGVRDQRTGQPIEGPNAAFSLTLADGSPIASSSMRMIGAPRIQDLRPQSQAPRLSERLPGRSISASFEDALHGVRIEWRAVLREGSHYLRQEVDLFSLRQSVPIKEVTMVEFDARGAEVVGTAKGSPVTAGRWFFGFENPLSSSSVEGSRVRCALSRQLPLEHGRTAMYSSVIGVAAPTQLRRDFLRYIERERAHPYRTFLHYNSWYDLGYFTPYGQEDALEVIRAFAEELHTKRNVVLDSFLFDDGWDDHHSLWSFNSRFPNGFAPLKDAAEKCGAAPGVWLSPWGGYDGPRKERLAYGKQHGYEENSGGFELSGPRYFDRFRAVCLEMIRKYGIDQFKFDGTGNVSTVFPGSKFDSDFAAMISLIGDLRAAEPNLYVNLTSGTYPSPFWLHHADSIWRDGEDHSFAGIGTNRQQWMTYRDAATYDHVVRGGPLYPLNSLMLHGLIYARYAEKLNDDPGHDFVSEIRSYFGAGTQLQEMYITHSLLSDSDWNNLAEASRWSRRNADILVDTHWIGSDPEKLESYGWAAWSPRGGIVTLRNPDAHPHVFELDPQAAFELPAGAAEKYVARSPWSDKQDAASIELRVGNSHTLTLQPFEVLTLEAAPR